MIGWMAGWPTLQSLAILYCYKIVLGVAATAFVVMAFRQRSLGKTVAALTEGYYPHLVCLVSAGMWFALFLNFFAISPRYQLGAVPLLILCLSAALVLVVRIKPLYNALLVASMVGFSWASFGRLHYPLIDNFNNYHVWKERSLEYRTDLKLNLRLAEVLEKKYWGLTVGAPFLTAQTLAMPELGYVRKGLNVLTYGMRVHYGDIKNFGGLKKGDMLKTVWVGLGSDVYEQDGFRYPVGPGDRVVERIDVGDEYAMLFLGGFAIENKRKGIEQWMIQQWQLEQKR